MLRRGEISVGVVVPPDFERRRIDGREAVQVLVDGSDTAVQGAAAQLAQMPIDSASTRDSRRRRQISVVGFYNPERRSAINIVPGLIGVILTMTMVMFTARGDRARTRARQHGAADRHAREQQRTDDRQGAAVRGHRADPDHAGADRWARGCSRCRCAAALLDVYLAAVLLILANLSLGLLISTKAQSQFQAMQMTFFVFLPSILLSGFMFPFAGMPKIIQWLAEVLPLTHFLRLIRGVMLRGASLLELWPDVLALIAFTAVMMTAAILRFQKRLD